MINRKEYLDELIRWKDKDLIKVVTGIRRCGKSTLFELYIDYLKNEGVKSHQIIHINLEDANYDFKDYKELYRFVNKKINIDEKFYVFLDEVQNVPEFQKAVDSLYIKKNIDVYITGLLYGLETMIYSVIYSFIDSLTIDKMHEQNICSTAFIFCKTNPKEINDYIKNELGRDFTYWDAKGGYDDSRTYIIYTALTKYELIKLERKIKESDFNAFMIKSEGIGIKGEFEKKF